MARIAVFAALRWECQPVLEAMRRVHRDTIGGFTRWRGAVGTDEAWVVKSGVGPARAAAAAAAIDLACCALIVSTGCAGGLDPALRVGDLIIADAVQGDGARYATDAAARAHALARAAASGLRAREGAIRCSATVLASVAAKRSAASAGAVAVEMEGAPIAVAAGAAGVPFLSVRAVLDGADDDLTTLGPVTHPRTGRVRPLALAGHFVRHPDALAGLLALRRAQQLSQARLARFFALWLPSALA